jgi:hypothetical protein
MRPCDTIWSTAPSIASRRAVSLPPASATAPTASTT